MIEAKANFPISVGIYKMMSYSLWLTLQWGDASYLVATIAPQGWE